MREIIILGSGPKWDTCPFDKETWVVGKMLAVYPDKPIRADMIFALDDLEHLLTIRRGVFTRQQFIDRINKAGVPYFSSQPHPEISLSREYPLKEVMDALKVPYFANTIAYMIAYAIHQQVTSISLYGVAQMGAHEYVAEKGCVEFWLGMAMGMGIQVSVETPSLLMRNTSEYPYGYMKTIKQLKDEEKL